MLVNILKKYLSPVKYLSSVNIITTGAGAVVGIINARLLGPEALGVVGIIFGIYGVTSNFIDIRLVDIVGKLYYRTEIDTTFDGKQYRASVIQIYFLATSMLAVLIWAVYFFVTSWFVGYFTEAHVKAAWIAMSAFYFSLNYIISAMQYQQRFSEKFYLIGTWRLLGYFAGLLVFLPILFSKPNLDGYFFASLMSTSLSAVVTVALSLFIWKKHEGFQLMNGKFLDALPDYIQEVRLILWGNLLGYTKLLHRGSDILLVGFFADDRITGLYKIARTFADSTFIFYDSLNQVYYPRLMQLLSSNAVSEYRHLAVKILVNSGLLVGGILLVEWIGLKYLIVLILTDKFQGAEPSIMILTSTLFFTMGVHLWLWPIFIHSGQLGLFTGYSIAAGLLQYLIVILAFQFWTSNSAAAALGYLGYYLFLIPIMWYLAKKIKPEIFVTTQRKKNKGLSKR